MSPSPRFPALFAVLAPLVLADAASAQVTRPPPVTDQGPPGDAEAMLRDYAESWRGAEETELGRETVLGFRIAGERGGDFTVILTAEGPGTLRSGFPETYDVAFETDLATLRKIHRGRYTALTAMGQARADDPIPLVPRFPDGFEWTAEARGEILPLLFHFWTRSWPETVRFGDGTTRRVHGANAAVLYYDRGLRTAWYQIEPGMHMNEAPEEQTNPFDTMVVLTRGEVTARIDGEVRTIHEGEAVLIPEGTKHEFWAESDQHGEFLIVMFGEGA